MNRFQAMAQIMAILTEDSKLKPGSREYKLARKLVTKRLDRLGPVAALASVRSNKEGFVNQIEMLSAYDELGRPIPETKF